jgi:hypothetical protein
MRLPTETDTGRVVPTDEVCAVCGNTIKVVTYQARSADEAPKIVRICMSCPLQAKKLSTRYAVRDTKWHMVKHNREVSASRLHVRRSKRYAQCVLPYDSIDHLGTSAVPGATDDCIIYEVKDADSGAALIGISYATIDNSELECDVMSYEACPGIRLVHRQTYLAESQSSGRHIVVSKCWQIRVDEMEFSARTVMIEIDITDMDQAAVYDVFHTFYELGAAPKSASSSWYANVPSVVHTHKARAHDISKPPDTECLYTSKPDGQRAMAVMCGCVWVYFTSDLSANLLGWLFAEEVDPVAERFGKHGPVLDVEITYGSRPLLIDIIIDGSGNLMPATRRITDVIYASRQLPTIGQAFVLRSYWNSAESAEEYRQTLPYPTDGIVAIDSGSVEMMKLKQIKSVELEVIASGQLASSDGVVVFDCELTSRFAVGDIVEVRFRIEQREIKEMRVTSAFKRVDKTRANAFDAVIQILQSTVSVSGSPSLLRRYVNIWSSSLRSYIMASTTSVKGRGDIVLDLGSGDGQAVHSYSECNDAPMILVERDGVRADKLVKRLRGSNPRGTVAYTDSPKELALRLGALRKRQLKYVVFNQPASCLLDNDVLLSALNLSVKCVTASFSLSHVHAEVRTFARLGFPVIACGYFYDGVAVGDYLFNSASVSMHRSTMYEATVKWGTDRKYTERALVRVDFAGHYLQNGSTCVPLPAADNANSEVQDAARLCSYVLVLRSRV